MIHFRPHHFLCTLGFRGKGYSPDFVENFQALADQLREAADGDARPIRVTAGTDAICAPCPNRRGTGCANETKIRQLDAAHAEALGISAGEVLRWGEAKSRIAEKISDEIFAQICADCSWRSLGVCQSALEELREEIRSSPP